MTGSAVRLQAIIQAPDIALFAIEFAAPVDEEEVTPLAAPLSAELAAGDGACYDLGSLAPPGLVTWREQRTQPLIQHRYAGKGPYTAELRLSGVVAASALVHLGAPPRAPAMQGPAEDGPALFALAPVTGAAMQRILKLHARALRPGQRLRVDAGAGQVRELAGEDGQELVAEMLLSYAKPGTYLVSVELLDGEGFWQETVAQTPLEIVAPETVGAQEGSKEPATTKSAARAVGLTSVGSMPWLPYRNFKARPEGARTYSLPGGGVVRRYAGAGLWMSARAETTVGGVLWYQTAAGDWIRADQVEFFQPSDLRGVVLDATAPPPTPPPPTPPPPTPPPPVGNRKGVVTATVLNVRRKPGVSANNPSIAVLRAGAQVTIYEEQPGGDGIWYRIGSDGVGRDRWVSGAWVRVVEARAASESLTATESLAMPFGWVVPDLLDVRANPGVARDNPVTGQLQHYDVRRVLQTATANGASWHQVGDQEWVEARRIGVARLRSRPASIPAGTLWVGVNLSQQTVVCYEGDRPVYATLAATGLAGTPTVQGIFKTWRRLDTGKMSGPGYYIEDVTWTCYFYSGYALHIAYWHDKFGTQRSHGCVNLSPYDAWWIYQWSGKAGPNSPTVYVYWS